VTRMAASVEYHRLRAPREHGQTLVEPPLDEAGGLLERNETDRQAWDFDLCGKSIGELATEARQQLIRDAHSYTSEYLDVGPVDALSYENPRWLVLAGHQPGLFHPGVWAKNRALGYLGQRYRALAINILVDNDVMRSPSIRVPSGSISRPRVAAIAFDSPDDLVPYEERQIVDRSTFDSFADRVSERLSTLVKKPMIEPFWPSAIQAADSTGNLGQSLAQARHIWEARWQSPTLELPLSRVCQADPFRQFMLHLLANLAGFRQIYNDSVINYRHVNHIRSHSHPVPNLTKRGDWIEAPFWIWDRNNRLRRHLFVRRQGNQLLLSDLADVELAIESPITGQTADVLEQLAQYEASGYKIRPRALITTMYSRLLLGDLFVHGIGGAKYDQLTDAIIERFFGVRSPSYMVVSATCHLPIPREEIVHDDVRRVERHLRDIRFHPEVHLDDNCLDQPEVAELVALKQRWIAATPEKKQLRQRHRDIKSVNDSLQPCLRQRREQLEQERSQLVAALRNEGILRSREYAFCLFPQHVLDDWLLDIFSQ